MSLSDNQLAAITAAERGTSILSVIGTTIVIGTFLSSPSFRKPINRVVFYAAWANILTNVGTLISRTAIVQKEHGEVLCQFQAFIIQWFMPSDALWTFAMAFNVYLTFVHKYDAAKLRRLEWKYILLCYGLPFIPSFAYFFISTPSKGPVYGSATLWCWVAVDWDILRIAVFYGPVWFVILLTFAIYAHVGIDIARKRRTLQSFNRDANMMMDDRMNSLFEVHASKVVQVTSEAANDSTANGQTQGSSSKTSSQSNSSSSHVNGKVTAFPAYSVVVAGGGVFALPPSAASTVGSASVKLPPTSPWRHPRTEISSAAFAYGKYALLYFIALLVTWVPSTINRVYSLIYPDAAVFGLEFVSSFVLPLQGFWNSIIYLAVSWSTVMEFVHGFRARRQPSSSSASEMRLKQYFGRRNSENGVSQVGRRVSDDAESTTHFAKDAEGVQGL